jgi:hypothetical protein
LYKDKDGNINFKNEFNSDLVMDDNQDEDEYKDVEPKDDPENLLKLLGIYLNAGDGGEVK